MKALDSMRIRMRMLSEAEGADDTLLQVIRVHRACCNSLWCSGMLADCSLWGNKFAQMF